MTKETILEAVRQYTAENVQPRAFQPGDRINYAGRVYDADELTCLVDASLDFWLTAGKYTKEFETEFGEFLGVPYVSLTTSGSSANLLAVMALTSPLLGERRLQKGDEVITVAAGFPTTVAPIVQAGAVPVFIDIDIPSYNADMTQLEAAVSPKTKAVIFAHSLGCIFDLATVKAFCDRHGLWLIEDNCDALGGTYELDGKTYQTGTVGDIGTSSFYPAHHITMGEGGAVYTKNPLLHKIIRSLRDWGRDCTCPGGVDNSCGHRFTGQYGTLPKGYDHKYVYSHLGFNLKVTDMQAAIGCAQLRKLPDFIEKRKANWNYLHEKLADLTDVLILPEAAPHSDPSWFGFLVSVKDESPVSCADVVAAMEAHNIQTRRLFAGNLTRHPCFEALEEGKDYRIVGSLERTDYVMEHSFWMGVYPGMTKEMLDYMVQALHTVLKKVHYGGADANETESCLGEATENASKIQKKMVPWK